MNTLQKSVENLLETFGYTESYQQAIRTRGEFHLRLEMPHYDPLVIEVLGNLISVAHYWQHPSGDAMRDPEMTFSLSWLPLTFRNDGMNVYQEAYPILDGKQMIAPRLVREFKSFAAQWGRNIRDQRWERALATSSTHGGQHEEK